MKSASSMSSGCTTTTLRWKRASKTAVGVRVTFANALRTHRCGSSARRAGEEGCGPWQCIKPHIGSMYAIFIFIYHIKTNNYNVGKYIIDDGSYGYWHTGHIIENIIINCWKMWIDIKSICFLLLFLELLLFKAVFCYCIVSCCSLYSYVCTWRGVKYVS